MKTSPNHYNHIYYSWSEFVDAVTKAKPRTDIQCGTASLTVGDEDWYGTNTKQEALDYFHKGWQQGINKVRNIQRSLPTDLFDAIMSVKDYAPELRHVIAGGGVDVSSFLSGATPENFIAEVAPIDNNAQIVRGKKLITIYADIWNCCAMSEESFLHRGAYTFALIEHLEQCGYSVELWTVSPCKEMFGSLSQTIYIKTKDFGEMLDTNKMVVSLASNFMFRRLIFALQETYEVNEIEAIPNNNYGIHNNLTPNEISIEDNEDVLWITLANINSETKMLEKFKQILTSFVNKDGQQ